MNNKSKIAIVGIGGVFPGARNLDEFWQNIVSATDTAVEAGADRWRLSPDELYAPTLTPDRVNSRRACLVQDFQFDATGLRVDMDLLNRLDPMYQILLHAGRDAWADTRTAELDRQRVGIVIGNIVLPTESSSLYSDELFRQLFEQQLFNSEVAAELSTESLNRYVAGLPGGLLAKALGLGAGAYTLDAACASSLYSLKYAIDELQSGRCDAMLAGGLSRPDCLYTQMGFSQLNAISKSGRCSPFDSKADGLVVGEGAGIFVLKRLEDAIAHDDHIYATIAGVGLSNDIEGNIMSPDSEGQLRAMLSAYEKAGWKPNEVQHVECHGTGTPVGDGVEFHSLNELWHQYGVDGDCVIGSVKSNVGHLLTAAGAAALMKTLLAMKHGQLPPTANFEQASDKLDLSASPFRVLQQAEHWETQNTPRRAAISGFGFGGINAHVLLEQYSKEFIDTEPKTVIRDLQQETIAIVGMDTRLGPWHDQAHFNEACLLGANRATSTPSNWWGADSTGQQGHIINEVSVPLGRYRIPPAELKEMLPQQLLMLEVAANALADAGLSELTKVQQVRSGVFIGIALDMNTTNFHFRWMQQRYAREWIKRLGLVLNETEFNEWVEQLRTACGPALSANRTMGALGGIVASRIARAFRIGGPSFTVSAEETSGLRALESGVRALQQRELDQVIVGAVDLASDLRAVQGHLASRELHSVADGATAFILKRHEDAMRDGDRVYALVKGIGAANGVDLINTDVSAQVVAMQNACTDANCHFDSVDQVCVAADDDFETIPALQQARLQRFALGYSGAANGLFAVAQAVSSLYQRVQPAMNNKQKACHWLKDRSAGPRRCLVNASSLDSNHMSILLQEGDVSATGPGRTGRLFIFAADAKATLLEQLDAASFATVTLISNAEASYRAALYITEENQFEYAKTTLRNAIETGCAIDDGRSFYSPEPLYQAGKLAFVYPGSGNHFYGMGQELGVAFPQVLEQLNRENAQLASQFARGRFWQADNGNELTHEEVIFGQVWLGTFVSDVVGNFAIKPDAVIGYSLGETAGFFSTRTWTARDEMLTRIQNSKLFTEELAGACTSVQRAWKTDQPVQWALGVINTSAKAVKAVLEEYSRVYLLIVNTPNECVIGGDQTQLQQAVAKLNAQYHPLGGVTTVHCEVAKPVQQSYRDLHIFETSPPEGVTFYSGIRGGAYEVTQDSAADSILDQALAPFDYTKVINSAYEDGVKLFIEMGPGGSCTRMIDQILDNKPHYAKAICVKGQDSVNNLLQTLARLYVEGVPLDLSSWIKNTESTKYDNFITVATGGQPFKVPSPPQPRPDVVKIKPAVSQQRQEARIETREQDVPLPMAANSGLQPLIDQMQQTEQARARAQETFLRLSQGMSETLAQALTLQMQMLGSNPVSSAFDVSHEAMQPGRRPDIDCVYDREQCMEFAIGRIGNMLGEPFADIDQFPTRVRLPDEPLMLVDRIIEIEGEANSLPTKFKASGRVVTEHDVKPNAWYLDQGRIPTCIAVESGQADLFLSGYLGIDHITKGNATYRLLDAQITFHGPLPQAGETIRYDIQIDHFFRQGDTWLFRFNFEGTVNGKPLLTMTNGCAGFFTRYELDAGQGIVLTSIERQPAEGKLTGGYTPLLPMQIERIDDEQMDALRRGDLAGCFGEAFSQLGLNKPAGLPGGRMTLVHRILKMDPGAGRFGLGQITGEADIHPDDWFLTCHFVDDRVMPGTLMYECCLHTLRVYLLRMGWVGEVDEFVYEPIIDEVSTLKCRGQVIETTKAVQYEITLKEIGYKSDGTPYVLADALMSADQRPVVQMKNMSVQLTGLRKSRLEQLWQIKEIKPANKQVLFDNESILAFATGKPSEAFGERYKVFDGERKIARLPGPPYKFLDRITSIKDCEQWQLRAGGVIEAEYDVPVNEWYFEEDNQPYMPFAVLLEVALQPCGWLAAYLGSALTSDTDLSFRNLGGKATQFMDVTPTIGTLKTRVKITNVSQSGGMIIQNFDYEMQSKSGLVYKGDTYFGFFSQQALADQVGIREAQPYQPAEKERQQGEAFSYPTKAPLPGTMMRMVHEISLYLPHGGPHGKGYIEGTANVNPDAWFFKAHFYQDPVWPGSLGLESLMQLLKVFAARHWQSELQDKEYTFESMALNQQHEWIYRGQILPTDAKVSIQAVINDIDEMTRTVTADGFLSVDGRIIYQMKDFALRIRPS